MGFIFGNLSAGSETSLSFPSKLWKNNKPPPQKNIHAQVPPTCENVRLHGKRELRLLTWAWR